MSEAPGGRLTITVGKREFEDMTDAWAAYRDVTEPAVGGVDPILALQRTGDVLRSVEHFLATVDSSAV